jgi:hypothetical protein
MKKLNDPCFEGFIAILSMTMKPNTVIAAIPWLHDDNTNRSRHYLIQPLDPATIMIASSSAGLPKDRRGVLCVGPCCGS